MVKCIETFGLACCGAVGAPGVIVCGWLCVPKYLAVRVVVLLGPSVIVCGWLGVGNGRVYRNVWPCVLWWCAVGAPVLLYAVG